MRNELKTLVFAVAVAGCGDSGGRGDSDGTNNSAATPGTLGVTLSGGTDGETDAIPTTGATDSGSDSNSDSNNPSGNSESNSQGPTGDSATTNDTNDTGVPKTDLGVLPDFDLPTCGGGGGGGVDDPDFSYIWIANSSQNTISKIDTQTLVELGRYQVRPDGGGSPSRTSVNLSGDVVVASRQGGLTKFYAREDSCTDSNGVPGIQTAVDANWLPWGQEECLAWHTPMPYSSQRPAAWTQGTFNESSCKWEDQKVWTSGNKGGGNVDILLVNGDTGVVEATVAVSGIKSDSFGIYGAAVDKDGNFWGSQLSVGHLVHVNLQTLQHKVWPMPTNGYGMTVDSKGYVWTCSSSAARFDPATELWQTANVGGSGGCMEDGKGTLYMSGGGNKIVALDTDTLAVKANYDVPAYVHGISIDFYGYVWGVSMGSQAFRVDPVTAQFETFPNLVGAYTYSDMTGFALSNVGTPPQG